MSGLFGGGSSTTTSTTTPYSGQYANQLDDFYNNYLKKKLNSSATPYTGQLTSGMSDTQKNAQSGLSSLLGSSALSDTVSGKYLDPSTNPYLSQYYNEAANQVSDSLSKQNDYINGQFNTRGLYNSSMRQQGLEDNAKQADQTLGNLATNIYGNAYNQERQNQMSAINQESNLLGQQFNQGTTEQQTNQAADTANYQEWLRQQGVDEQDIQNMLQYFGLVKNPSQTSTTESSGGLGSLFSGALYGLGSTLGKKI